MVNFDFDTGLAGGLVSDGNRFAPPRGAGTHG